MAPEKSAALRKANFEKEVALWESCSRQDSVPASFLAYKLAVREFGITFKVKLTYYPPYFDISHEELSFRT